MEESKILILPIVECGVQDQLTEGTNWYKGPMGT